MTPKEWGIIVEKVSAFFDRHSAEEIEKYNEILFCNRTGHTPEQIAAATYQRKTPEPVFHIPDRFLKLPRFCQTKGWVYCLTAESREGFKIGQTSKGLRSRIRRNSYELASPVTVIDAIHTAAPTHLEKYLHQHFRQKHVSGDWFNLTQQDIADIPIIAYHFNSQLEVLNV